MYSITEERVNGDFFLAGAEVLFRYQQPTNWVKAHKASKSLNLQ